MSTFMRCLLKHSDPLNYIRAVIWMLSSSGLGGNSQPLTQRARCAAQSLACAGRQRRFVGQAALSGLSEPGFPSRPSGTHVLALCGALGSFSTGRDSWWHVGHKLEISYHA